MRRVGRVRRVVVVGGGIGGLSAARLLSAQGDEVVVLEASSYAGGKLRSVEVGGTAVDVGAEAMLNRRPEGVELARSLGLDVVHPTAASSRIWTRGALRSLPRSLMGVPLDLAGLRASGVLSEAGLARVAAEESRPAGPLANGEDVSVGELVAARLGDEVVDRLVEPLLGGVYAGHARQLSARATVPALVAAAERGRLTDAVVPAVADVPVFAGLAGGLAGLPAALAADLDVRMATTVRELRRTPTGFALVVGPTTAPETVEADAVLLATPAAPTARLLAEVAPAAAAELGGIDYASVAVVTLVLRAGDLPLRLQSSSGFLVPPLDDRTIKAATFSFAKWDWVRAAGAPDGLVHLRTSLGRHGEAATLQRDDAELVAASLRDLADAVGLSALPVASHVQRWGGALPQYAVGHLDRVARIRAAVARVPGLAVCGAAYDGVGVPAVVASARAAVTALGTAVA